MVWTPPSKSVTSFDQPFAKSRSFSISHLEGNRRHVSLFARWSVLYILGDSRHRMWTTSNGSTAVRRSVLGALLPRSHATELAPTAVWHEMAWGGSSSVVDLLARSHAAQGACRRTHRLGTSRSTHRLPARNLVSHPCFR
jgi:hypothetical protein